MHDHIAASSDEPTAKDNVIRQAIYSARHIERLLVVPPTVGLVLVEAHFAADEHSLSVIQIAARAQIGVGAVRRRLAELTRVGHVKVMRAIRVDDGTRHFGVPQTYRVDPATADDVLAALLTTHVE